MDVTDDIWVAPETLTMDGYDDRIVGVVEQFGRPPVICYDKRKIIARFLDDNMSEEEALEFFEFNQLGAWVGEYTPCFATLGKVRVSDE